MMRLRAEFRCLTKLMMMTRHDCSAKKFYYRYFICWKGSSFLQARSIQPSARRESGPPTLFHAPPNRGRHRVLLLAGEANRAQRKGRATFFFYTSSLFNFFFITVEKRRVVAGTT